MQTLAKNKRGEKHNKAVKPTHKFLFRKLGKISVLKSGNTASKKNYGSAAVSK